MLQIAYEGSEHHSRLMPTLLTPSKGALSKVLLTVDGKNIKSCVVSDADSTPRPIYRSEPIALMTNENSGGVCVIAVRSEECYN